MFVSIPNSLNTSSQVELRPFGMNNLIISLTSYPARIKTIHFVIESLFGQTVKPWKIILWLAKEEFPDGANSLPQELTNLAKDSLFEIGWTETNYRPYNKLVHALRKYPDCAIITVDDDLIYPPDMVERLLAAHEKYPEYIKAMRVRTMTAKAGIVQPFLDWLPTWIGGQNSAKASFDNSILGFGGALYPPHCLDPRVLDMDMAMATCPKNDDFWFWAMAVLKGTKIAGVNCNGYAPKPIVCANETSLWAENGVGGNDLQMQRLFARFPEIMERLALSHLPLPKGARHVGGLIRSVREGNRAFSVRLNVPLFQMKYSEDFSSLTYYILKIPVYRRRC